MGVGAGTAAGAAAAMQAAAAARAEGSSGKKGPDASISKKVSWFPIID